MNNFISIRLFTFMNASEEEGNSQPSIPINPFNLEDNKELLDNNLK